MTRVCHMTSAHKNQDIRIFHKECVSLAEAGYEVYLVAQGESFDSKGVHIIGVPANKGGRFSRMTGTAKAVYRKALELDSDIYHFHDPELLPYGLKLAKRGKRVIFDSHEFYDLQISEKYYFPKWTRGAVRRLFIMCENYVLHRIDAIIFPCTFKGINPFAGRAKKTVLLSNSPLLSELNYENVNNAPKKKKAICYVGGLTHNRGITHLIKAAYKAEVKLILGGRFSPEHYQNDLESMLEYSCVDYRGFLNRDGVAKIIRESDIGMCTTLKIGQYNQFDTLATKVYEYWSMGVPVIVTNRPYAREVFKKYDCGICVDPDDTDAIADAIKYLLDNTDIAKQMGENGRRAVLEEFNWAVEEKKLLGLYEELIIAGKQNY